MTQPTLSRQIKDLEDELGQKLLVRGSHRVTLTAEGMLLRRRAEEIVSMTDKTEEEFRAMKGNLSGDIYIGGGETDAMNLIACCLPRNPSRNTRISVTTCTAAMRRTSPNGWTKGCWISGS